MLETHTLKCGFGHLPLSLVIGRRYFSLYVECHSFLGCVVVGEARIEGIVGSDRGCGVAQ